MEVTIRIKNQQERFTVGDSVVGAASLTLPEGFPLDNVRLSFTCLGEVKWVEYQGTPYYGLEGNLHYDHLTYHKEELKLDECDTKVVPHMDFKTVTVPFEFKIPEDKNLPSTMISIHGSIQYSVNVDIKPADGQGDLKNFQERIIVQSPTEHNLMLAVSGGAEKPVVLHNGKANLYACIARKGFAQGENITVHIAVDNQTNAKLVPRISLHQVQIYTCGQRHKAIENRFPAEAIKGTEIEPHTKSQQVLDIQSPEDENLTIKSEMITVKYFVEVTLDIPHSLDLHVNLPVVITAKSIIEKQQMKKSCPELISA